MFAECATAVACRIATYLDLGSHTRLSRTSQRFGAACALRAASPVEVRLPRSSADLRLRPRSAALLRAQHRGRSGRLAPGPMLRHYQPLRLTCSLGADGSLDFLTHQPQLRSLTLHVSPSRDDVETHERTFEFLAHLPRDVASPRGSHLAAATALTELRLTDAIDLARHDRYGDTNEDRRAPSERGALYWAAALSQLEVLELRCAPDLKTFRGLDGVGGDRCDTDVADDASQLVASTRLRALEVRDVTHACDVTPLRALSALRSLTLGTRWRSTPLVGLANLPVGLRRLRLDTTTATGVDLLRHLTRLTHLACACGAAVLSLKPLAALGRLRVLQLTHCLAVRSLDGLERLTRLERLTLEDAAILQDCMAIALLPRLGAFTLTDLGDPELHDTMPPLSHLAYLSVRWTAATDPFFYALVTDGTLVERILGYHHAIGGDHEQQLPPSDRRVVASNRDRPSWTTAVVVNDGAVANVRLPSGSPVRVFTAAEYDASLGRATHDVHQHALARRVVRRCSTVVAATANKTDRDASDDAGADLCDRCVREFVDGADEWTYVPCDFHLCERCAAATRSR